MVGGLEKVVQGLDPFLQSLDTLDALGFVQSGFVGYHLVLGLVGPRVGAGLLAAIAVGQVQTLPESDLASQLAQAHENIKVILAEAGSSVADIVRITSYIVNYTPADGEVVNAANFKLFEGLTPPSANLIGGQALYAPDIRCEVEVTAVIGG